MRKNLHYKVLASVLAIAGLQRARRMGEDAKSSRRY